MTKLTTQEVEKIQNQILELKLQKLQQKLIRE